MEGNTCEEGAMARQWGFPTASRLMHIVVAVITLLFVVSILVTAQEQGGNRNEYYLRGDTKSALEEGLHEASQKDVVQADSLLSENEALGGYFLEGRELSDYGRATPCANTKHDKTACKP